MRRLWIPTIPATLALAAFALAPAGCGGSDSDMADMPDVSAGQQAEGAMESAQTYADEQGRRLREQISDTFARIEDQIDELGSESSEENVVSRQAEMAQERLEALRERISGDASEETLRNVSDEAEDLSDELEQQLNEGNDSI
jgi:hypothetical protein